MKTRHRTAQTHILIQFTLNGLNDLLVHEKAGTASEQKASAELIVGDGVWMVISGVMTAGTRFIISAFVQMPGDGVGAMLVNPEGDELGPIRKGALEHAYISYS